MKKANNTSAEGTNADSVAVFWEDAESAALIQGVEDDGAADTDVSACVSLLFSLVRLDPNEEVRGLTLEPDPTADRTPGVEDYIICHLWPQQLPLKCGGS